MKHRKLFLFVPILLSALFLLLHAPSAQAAIVNGGTIAKGVRLGDVELGGMTLEEATQAVEDYCQELAAREFTVYIYDGPEASQPVTDPDAEINKGDLLGTYKTTLADLGFEWSAEASLKKATTYGQKGKLIELYKNLQDLQYDQVILPLECSVKADAIMDFVQNTIAASANKPVEKPSFTVNSSLTKVTLVSGGSTGITVDVTATAERIFACFENGLPQEYSCNAVVEIEKVAAADYSGYSFTMLGECKTYVNTKEAYAKRNQNVSRGMALINGTVLMPGESFSIVEGVSPVTVENGYTTAGVFSGGRVIQGLGGGLCQVSSTICGAVLQAELEIVLRYPHSMVVDYIPVALDAAVDETPTSYGYSKDFIFRNTTDAPIYIATYMVSGEVCARIFGHETRGYSRTAVSFESEILYQRIINPTYIFDTSRNASEPVTEGGYLPETKAQSYKVITVNGQTTKEALWYNEYRETAGFKVTITCNMLGLYTQRGGNGRDLIYDRNGNLLLTDDHGVPYYDGGSGYLLAKDYVCDQYGIAHTPGGSPVKKNQESTTPAPTTPEPTTPEPTTPTPTTPAPTTPEPSTPEETEHQHHYIETSRQAADPSEDDTYIYYWDMVTYTCDGCGHSFTQKELNHNEESL